MSHEPILTLPLSPQNDKGTLYLTSVSVCGTVDHGDAEVSINGVLASPGEGGVSWSGLNGVKRAEGEALDRGHTETGEIGAPVTLFRVPLDDGCYRRCRTDPCNATEWTHFDAEHSIRKGCLQYIV